MHDSYQMPALVFTMLLLPAFGHLYFRTRDTRNLLWLIAFFFIVVRMLLVYPEVGWNFSLAARPWVTAAGEACAILASGLFLGSLSPLRFKIGKLQGLYVVPYIVPLILYALLANGLYANSAPRGFMFWFFPGLGLISVAVGLRWDQAKGSLPSWSGTVACVLFGGLALLMYFRTGPYWSINLAESGNHVITALLVIWVFRRWSPGVVISAVGFLVWALPILFILPSVYGNEPLNLLLLRCVVLSKVVTALGLILLALENELAANMAAGQRERQARQEMEAYASVVLSRRRVEEFDRQAEEICQMVVSHSRFSKAALILLQSNGIYKLAGSAGFDRATSGALGNLAGRIPASGFLAPRTAPPAVENSLTVHLDFTPWLAPGDDLERLKFTSALAVPLHGRTVTEGVLLLAGSHFTLAAKPLRAQDLIPIETLALRLQGVRSQTRMLEKLVDSEKYAGLGQLAASVTQQLNNPLTVILGYASMLEEAHRMDAPERKGIEAILSAARGMRSTIESLQRVARAPGSKLAAISVSELLADMEQLHRADFLQRSIEFRLNVAPGLPRVLCQPHQLRQAVLHCLQFAMDAIENEDGKSDRTVRLEASAEGNHVQILVAHSGIGFEHPERAFDPFVSPQASAGETAGLGLSLCATILRDNHGHASAVNLDPRGAAIVLELQGA